MGTTQPRNALHFRELLNITAMAARFHPEIQGRVVPHSGVLEEFDDMIESTRIEAKLELLKWLVHLIASDDELGDVMEIDDIVSWLRHLEQYVKSGEDHD